MAHEQKKVPRDGEFCIYDALFCFYWEKMNIRFCGNVATVTINHVSFAGKATFILNARNYDYATQHEINTSFLIWFSASILVT